MTYRMAPALMTLSDLEGHFRTILILCVRNLIL